MPGSPRIRITAAFAAAMALILVAVGTFVYTRGEDELVRSPGGAPIELEDEALDWLEDAFLIVAPFALLAAAGFGYLIAGRALAPVEESIERQRAFVSDASHELRTPLAVLKAELELAAEPGRSADDLRAAIDSAADEVDRLARLADDLLILARSDQGELQVRREQADVGSICARVARRFGRRADELGRELIVDCAAGGPVAIDVLRVEQALGNLIDNALRHGQGAVTVSSRIASQGLFVEVRDEGPGIPAPLAPHAFERFSRGDAARTEGGAGLGLSIVKAIAEAHGGTAEIDGATVRLTLPMSR